MANERARSLRRNATDAERKLWRALRQLKPMGFHFRRQVPIDHLIVDFACFQTRLIIEVDGGQHGMPDGQRTDRLRDAHLANHHFRILRFWNNDVLGNIGGVMEIVMTALGSGSTPTPDPSPQGGGEQTATRRPT